MSDFIFSGFAAQLQSVPGAYVLPSVGATFTLTGSSATLNRNIITPMSAGSYTLTGNDALFATSKVIMVLTGEYTTTGMPALVYHTVIPPTDPEPYIERAWVPVDSGLDSGLTVDEG